MGKHTNKKQKSKKVVHAANKTKKKIFWTSTLIQQFEQRATNYTRQHYQRVVQKHRLVKADESDPTFQRFCQSELALGNLQI